MHRNPRRDDGISLVELLVTIAVLGVLAAVVVFSVRGSGEGASSTACAADARVVIGAQQAYRAQHGRYGTESDLVAGGLLRNESEFSDLTVEDDDFTVVPVAPCGSNAPTPPAGSGPSTTVASQTTSPPASSSTTSPTTTSTSTTAAPTPSSTTTSVTPTTMPATTTTTTSTTTSTSLPPASIATHLQFTVQPSNTPSRAVMSPFVVVTVRDAGNQIVESSTAPVTLAITVGSGSPAGRIVCDANTKTAIAGVATFTGCTISKAAAGYALTATSPGLAGVTSSTFNVT